MTRTEPIATPEHPNRRVLTSIDEHIADAVAARARALAKDEKHMPRRRPDPSRRLMLQLADAYVRELRASRVN